ncbi:prominin-like isoform x8 protein [Lasius niger]|uniref:Prominin-like isoform x8 protein n=1 Tax=Lasius niger TaxID=67767 RepID=A0A0J7KN07_LASNI|nr:prominin-like isoform x8 protein [Lasius niger]
MRAISEDLDRQLNEIMASQALTYSTIKIAGLPYNATTKFNPKGMGQLYNVTNMFIDLVQSKQAYPEGGCFFKKEVSRKKRRTRRDVGLLRVRARKADFPLAMVTPCNADTRPKKMAGRLLVNRRAIKVKRRGSTC